MARACIASSPPMGLEPSDVGQLTVFLVGKACRSRGIARRPSRRLGDKREDVRSNRRAGAWGNAMANRRHQFRSRAGYYFAIRSLQLLIPASANPDAQLHAHRRNRNTTLANAL